MNKPFSFKKFGAIAFTGAVLAVAHGTAQASFLVTYEAPTVTNTTAGFDYVGVENFNSLSTGVQSFSTDFGTTGMSTVITGSYSQVQINAADQFGGADDGAGVRGNYGVAFANTPYQLTLSAWDTVAGVSAPVTYFGYWLSALDRGNQVEFFRNGTMVYSFDPASVLALTGNCPGGSYCGNPVTDENMGEPYVFLNFYDESGLGFDTVSFFEAPAGGGYESDNHTVGFYNKITGDPIPTPAPGILALIGLGLAGLGWSRRRKV